MSINPHKFQLDTRPENTSDAPLLRGGAWDDLQSFGAGSFLHVFFLCVCVFVKIQHFS